MNAEERYNQILPTMCEIAGEDIENARYRRSLPYPLLRAIVMDRMVTEGYSHKEIANASGFDRSTVTQWSTKIRNIRANRPSYEKRLIELADQLEAELGQDYIEDKDLPNLDKYASPEAVKSVALATFGKAGAIRFIKNLKKAIKHESKIS